MAKYEFGVPFSVTASGTAIATATQAGTTGALYYITDVAASTSSSAGTFAVFSGVTPVWQGQLGSVVFVQSFVSPIKGVLGSPVSITANGSVVTYANISGYQLNTSTG